MILQKKTSKKDNPNWPEISDHPLRILKIAGSGSGKSNSFILNMINQQLDINKIHLYAKDPYKAKYQFLFKKRESTGLKHLNDSKAFIK